MEAVVGPEDCEEALVAWSTEELWLIAGGLGDLLL